MTDNYDEMRVSPDPAQAEALRERLGALTHGRSHSTPTSSFR